MKSAKLALNRWSMGQVLMPADLFTLQDTLVQHVAVRSQLHGLPAYGIAELAWDDALVPKGVVAIARLTVIFPSGELIDVPGNATISNLNLDDFQDNRAAIYLHVVTATREDVQVNSDGLDAQRGPVERLVHRVELSLKPWLDQAQQSMKLVELERDLGGDWRLGSYLPPLIQVGTSPFLLSHIAEHERALSHLATELSAQLADPYLGVEHGDRLRRGQAAIHRAHVYLADLRKQVHLHPYYLLDMLRQLYGELCLLQRLSPAWPPVLYDHDDLAGCFGHNAEQLREMLAYAPITSERLPFLCEDYYYAAAPFPEALSRASRVYLISKVPAGTSPGASFEGDIDLSQLLKLASPSRLELVHILSLSGVPMTKLESPGFAHTFGTRAHFYLLELGEEWAHAVREGALCFYTRDEIEGFELVLSWHR